MAETRTDPIVSQLEEVEPIRRGRPVAISPYLGAVKHADENRSKAFALTVQLNGTTKDEQDADLKSHIAAFRRAGNQLDKPVTVIVQSDDVNRKTGEVKVRFMVTDKQVRGPRTSGNGNATAPASS